jgi:hypothetical protein
VTVIRLSRATLQTQPILNPSAGPDPVELEAGQLPSGKTRSGALRAPEYVLLLPGGLIGTHRKPPPADGEPHVLRLLRRIMPGRTRVDLTIPQLAPPKAVGKTRQCVALGLAAGGRRARWPVGGKLPPTVGSPDGSRAARRTVCGGWGPGSPQLRGQPRRKRLTAIERPSEALEDVRNPGPRIRNLLRSPAARSRRRD